MCIAISNPFGKSIPQNYLKRSFRRNPHLCGYSVIHKGKMITNKGFGTFKEFYESYTPYKNCPGIIHFRWATTGDINSKNAHPFIFGNGKYSVIHNGVIHRVHPKKGNSDTAQFVKDVLKPMIKRLPLTSKDFKRKIRRFVGGANKLAFMSNKGEFVIINEKDGIWENNVWYSNADYRFIPPIKRTWRKLKGKFFRQWDKILSLDFLKQKA